MRLVKSHTTDPFYNVAAEEYLLRNQQDDFLFLWVNSPSVFIGKHQVANAEINHDYAYNGHIPVIRRITGGGTVFHDEGNLNFSFITSSEPGRGIDFKKYLYPLADCLHELGVQVTLNERNNLFSGEYKFSGTAAHLYKNRVVHHGTLLFSANREMIHNSLSAKTERYSSNAVHSVRSKIFNLSDRINDLDFIEFFSHIESELSKSFDIKTEWDFDSRAKQEINTLITSRYAKTEWNFGYSPDYNFKNLFSVEGELYSIELKVIKGIISEISGIAEQKHAEILKKMVHKMHEWNVIKQHLSQAGIPADTCHYLLLELF